MRKLRKWSTYKFISLVLAAVLLFTSVPFSGIGLESNPVAIFHDGNEVVELNISQDEKKTLSAQVRLAGTLSYQWQILADAEADLWVSIQGAGEPECAISYAVVGSLLDDAGKAQVRCKVVSGTDIYLSDPVTVTVSYIAPVTYAPPVEERPLLRGPAPTADPVNPDELIVHTIVVNYLFESTGTVAFEPFVATIADGEPFSYPVKSPPVVGYKPYIQVDGAWVDASTVQLDYASVTENDEITVYYRPDTVFYTVRHYWQHEEDDEYDLELEERKQGLTDSPVPDCHMVADGVTALYYEHLNIAADGSTVIEIFYDRNYYLVAFQLDGGYGVEPIYARYGYEIGVNNPTRPGWIFNRWDLVAYDDAAPTELQKAEYDINGGKHIEIPAGNLTYVANWERASSSYTIVYWKENAGDDLYSYWGSVHVGAVKNETTGKWEPDGTVISGEVVSGEDDIPDSITITTVNNVSVNERGYFTYNDLKTDKNVVVDGDGSTVVNVYYDRNYYTMSFSATGLCDMVEHTHSNGEKGCQKMICGLEEHTHNINECQRKQICTTPAHEAHTAECLICKKPEHSHSSSCPLEKCDHREHELSCYGATASENPSTDYLDLISSMENAGTNPAHGYVYMLEGKALGFELTKAYYLYYVDSNGTGRWYPVDEAYTDTSAVLGSNSESVILIGKRSATKYAAKTTCTHVHDNDCYSCGTEAHDHVGNCYRDVIHTHNGDCYELDCSEVEHSHSAGCYDKCPLPEHTHTTNCSDANSTNIVYQITAKYQALIKDDFPIKNSRGVDYSGVWWKVPSNDVGLVAGNYITSLDQMVGQDLTLTYYTKGTDATLYYYVEALPGEPYDSLFEGKYFISWKTLPTRLSGNLTYQEEFHPIEGFTRWLSDPEFSSPSSKPAVQEKNYFNYLRNSYKLKFYNFNDYITDEEKTVLYQAPLKGLDDFTPDYPTDMEPNAYYFAGWYTTPECYDGSEMDFSSAIMPAGDLTVYAKWAPVNHTVNVYKDATLTEQLGATQTIPHKNLAAAPSDTPTNGNLTFAGWFYLDTNGNEKAFLFNSIPVVQSMDVYAKWNSKVPVQYSVSYKTMVNGQPVDIATPMTGSTMAGMNKTFIAKGGTELFTDYQVGYFPLTSSHTVTMSADGDNSFTFWYEAAANVPYKVEYVNAETGKVIDSKVISENHQAIVTERFIMVEGMMPDAFQKRLVLVSNGTDADGDGILDQNVLTFYYSTNSTEAFYRVVHYIQNLDGETYTEYRSIEEIEVIGQIVSTDVLPITGYSFVPGKTRVNDVVKPTQGTTVSETLTNKGLLIELFYDRNMAEYTVNYQVHNSDTILGTKTGTGVFGSQVAEDARIFEGYTLVSVSPQTLTLAADKARNVITFYYTEKTVTIRYEVIEGGGVLSFGSENVLAMTGTPQGSTPRPLDGCEFIGWYLDAQAQRPVPASWVDPVTGKLVPQRSGDEPLEEVTYYAKFIPIRTTLTIFKTGTSDSDVNQTFIFDIVGVPETPSEGIKLTVTIHGDDKVVIQGIPIGQYTITEREDWSWRYDGPETVTMMLSGDETKNVVTFHNVRDESQWLDGDYFEDNIFAGVFTQS